MIIGIDHVVLTVSDIDAAAKFYARVLGFRVEKFAGNRTALHIGDQKLNLQTLGQETRNNAVVGAGDICLTTQWHPKDVTSHLLDEGIKIAEGPVAKTGALGPITSVYFHDPDGNLIEISCYEKDTS